MKSLMLLWSEVLNEQGTWCHASTSLDLKKAKARFEHEGLSFLTITLPSYAADLQKGLEYGKVGPDLFLSFRRRGGLPLFLGGFLDRVFDRDTGILLDNPCVDSIFALRQLTLMFAKMLVPCTSKRDRAAITRYVECEKEVRRADSSMTERDLSDFHRLSTLLWGKVLSDADRKVDRGEIIPRHGPGSTADRLRGNAKYDLLTWPSRMEYIFPYGENAIPNWRYVNLLDRVDFLEPGAELPVRVVTVPKTLKTPRIIAIEPTCMQFMQQGIMEVIVEGIESNSLVSPLTGFTDQTPNQRMACEGSLTGNLATLDLSEASDRVSNQLVRRLLQYYPYLSEAVDSCRSRKADVPGHGVQRLAKFASMGSALTFPIEAMVFTTVVLLGIERARGRRLTVQDVKRLHGKVRVYGDDIIIPADMATHVIANLEAFGFKVNSDKSFWNGKFRESCGKEYYHGIDVSVSKFRRLLPASRGDVPEIISLISFRNQIYYSGLWRTAKMLDNIIRGLIREFPDVAPTSPVLGRHSYLGYETQRMCPELQRPLVKGYVVRSRTPASVASGEGALLKWFLKRGLQPFADKDHLERQGRPEAVDIKLRWAQPF